MVNLMDPLKIRQKQSYKNFQRRIHQKRKTPIYNNSIINEDDPKFYCSLCSKSMKYSELINGCKCSKCEHDLFIILWDEYKKNLWTTQIETTDEL